MTVTADPGRERLLAGLRDLRDGNFRRRLAVAGPDAELAAAFNDLAERNQRLIAELRRVTGVAARGEWPHPAVAFGGTGGWREAERAVEELLESLLRPVGELSRVLGAVAAGDLSQRMPRRSGERLPGGLGDVASRFNDLLDQLSLFASEVTRVAREVGSEGRLGGQAQVPGVAGTWRGLTDSVNLMADNLTAQVRNISQVAGAVARGDLSQKIDVDARGEILELKNTLNTMVDQLSAFADEVTRVSREVGTEGKLGGQARVPGVAGTWKDLTDNVNLMADNLTAQVRNIAVVASAVAGGDLSKKITVQTKGEVAALAETINGMVETLGAFADQVTLVAREVGTEGILGGQARVPGVAGTWKDLTDNVNLMARNLTNQVRNIAQVTTAVARGDLSKKIDVDAQGEILELKTTINTMVDQLSGFASEVTRVAREVGTEGKLGGQAEVADVSGTWQRLTESVNRLAGNLTTQVRAIAGVANAVTSGDLTRQITVAASGEVAELKDDINAMISNLAETTRTNEEQDWLKTHLTRLSGLLRGSPELHALASLIMTELVPLVSAQYGAFYLARPGADGEPELTRTATYGLPHPGTPQRFELGQSLVGQAAADRTTILVRETPPDYLRISSGLGAAPPVGVVVVPVLFEDEVLAVLELASVHEFSALHLDLLQRLQETIGVEVNTILANTRTEELLAESQRLARELRARSEQLEQQQNELQRSNSELAEKAEQLAARNRDIEIKNSEIERARQQLEEHAGELSQASAYKSEFLANMSHELRTPLNSSLLLAKLLADNVDGNLTSQQVDLARTIHAAGSDLLALINDVLDLSKVEAGRMTVLPEDVPTAELVRHLDAQYRPVAADKGLEFTAVAADSVPATIRTDQSRLEQILRNLLSNAVKFTERGSVRLRIDRAHHSGQVAFSVEDTGIGVPAGKLGRIFEAFQQGDGTIVREFGGTGLGLSISRELTALLGGRLSVDSEPGRGSTFTLLLPLECPDAEPEPDDPAPAAIADVTAPQTPAIAPSSAEVHFDVAAEGIDPPLLDRESTASFRELTADGAEAGNGRNPVPRFTGQRVLVVDDDPRSVYALTALLEQRGLRVVHADNGIAGLGALQEHDDVAIVLMDVMMPELDGDSTIRTIRRIPRHQHLPIIAVTAKAMPGDRERSLEAGATECVTKPVDAERLLRLLAEQLGLDPGPRNGPGA
ncbi:HAMP domain-containing protein [Saccharopolyspora sp. NPDC047091]|uniref:HAMP domain-containing protein n=1 Tax=Saccharopolyspora sp. NPDC047091 TaxID=3155924 RepID=UPI003405C5FB